MTGHIRDLIRSSPISSAVFFLCFLVFVSGFFVSWRRTEGVSMYPALSPGSILICSKSVDVSSLRYGSCVVADISYNDKDIVVVKRIVGCPGDKIQIIDGVLYCNGIKEDRGFPYMEEVGLIQDELILGDDEYFLLGDNRNVSLDSRDFGPVPAERITNVVLLHLF